MPTRLGNFFSQKSHPACLIDILVLLDRYLRVMIICASNIFLEDYFYFPEEYQISEQFI